MKGETEPEALPDTDGDAVAAPPSVGETLRDPVLVDDAAACEDDAKNDLVALALGEKERDPLLDGERLAVGFTLAELELDARLDARLLVLGELLADAERDADAAAEVVARTLAEAAELREAVALALTDLATLALAAAERETVAASERVALTLRETETLARVRETLALVDGDAARDADVVRLAATLPVRVSVGDVEGQDRLSTAPDASALALAE